jgi:Zn-dependent M16 (insulinase) family peptidase
MNFFTSPVNKDGKRLEFEDVVLELERDTVDYSIRANYVNPELVNISFCTEPQNYEKIVGWIRTLFFDAIHNPVRLHASLTKLLADIPDEKRSGDSMLSGAYFMVAYTRNSSARARSTLAKALYLRRTRKLLKDSPDEVISKFATVCAALHRPENFRIKVAGNIETLVKPVSTWNALTASHDTKKPLEPLDSRRACLSEVGKNTGSAAFIVPISAIDSSFAMFVADGPDSLSHPDLPALRVAQSYMNAVEGPMWVAVRGTGLAYGCYFNRSEDTGKFTFRVSRSPDAYKAYKAAKEQVDGYSSGKIPLDKFALEGAISEIVLDMANEQPTMSAAAELSYANQVIRGIEKDHSHKMLARVRDVTPEQIRNAMTKYMLPVFDPKKANLMVTCAPIMSEGVVGDFKNAGFKAEIKALDDFHDDYGMQAPEGEDEESEEEDDESGSEDGSESEDEK